LATHLPFVEFEVHWQVNEANDQRNIDRQSRADMNCENSGQSPARRSFGRCIRETCHIHVAGERQTQEKQGISLRPGKLYEIMRGQFYPNRGNLDND
jgi:hypothetical protein